MAIESIIEDLKRSIARSRTTRRGAMKEDYMKEVRRLIKLGYFTIGQPRKGERGHGFLTMKNARGQEIRIPCWF